MNTTSRLNSEEEFESFSIKNFLLLCLGYWKWFLASMIVFGGMSLFYLAMKQPVYERYEEILVKDQETGGGIGDVTGAFSDLGLFANQTKVYNELIAFTSPAVISEVVDRLGLTMNYTLRKGLKSYTLYGSTQPLEIEFPGLPDYENIAFRIQIAPDGKYTISKMVHYIPGGKEKFKNEVYGKVDGPVVKTPLGNIQVKTNDSFISLPSPVDEDMTIDVFRQGRQMAVEKYLTKVKGDLTDQDADVINLSIKDTSTQRADDILNMIVSVYNERWITDKNKVAVATSKFIADRLAVIEHDLGDVDVKLAGQMSAMRLPSLDVAAEGLITQEARITEEELKVTTMLAMSTYLYDYLKDPAHAYSIVPMNTGTENMVLEQMIGEYNTLLLQRNKLAENSSDDNPLVKDMNHQLAGHRNALLRSTDSYIQNLKSALATINKAQKTNQERLGTAPLQAQTLLSGERQQTVMQELYLFLLQKREETELSQAFTADNTRIITPPYGKSSPVAPKKSLTFIIALILGLGIPAGALFIAESANTKIRSKKDLESLAVPFAGEIPHIGSTNKVKKLLRSKKSKQKEIEKPKIVVEEGKRDIPNEAFRVVRSNIDFMLGKGRHAVIAFTSFNPGSGKSFVAYNLGLSFALKGKKVLLIDGDLRHGSISNYVNTPRKGITTYLNGTTDDWASVVVRDANINGLDVLPIGHRPPNPAELLDNGRIKTLIEEAKETYDLVLIDCPPINIVVDTQIINEYVDRTIFVVRAGLLEKKAVSELGALVEEDKLKGVTVLLNGTKTEFSSYHTYGNYEAIDNP